jgi:hypothetical protein
VGDLELELQAELNDAHAAIGGDLAKAIAVSVVVRIQELRVVECIEKLGAKLKNLALPDGGVLEQRKVEVVDARSAKRIPG